MKKLATLILTLTVNVVFGQYDEPIKDTYAPYLIRDTIIVGANTASLNKALGETDVDTIKYWIVFINLDTSSQVLVNGFNVVCSIRAIGLWVPNPRPPFGAHWDIFDLQGRLLSLRNILITQIVEVEKWFPRGTI